MSKIKESSNNNKITMSKKKFYFFLGSTIAVTIFVYEIVTQGIERLF
ncbi:hypothetical protein ABID56_001337 [Alkalibacillus flavidus]|uniref:Uncharacterized protein n=1 Tax=Alkalibacillus flavidus TaxID=546021 RepID=A0ABV2KXG4_9BACI